VRRQDWAQATSVGFALAGIGAGVRRHWRWAIPLLAGAAAADAAGRVASRRTPRPIPASMRWVLRLPHPTGVLQRALEPRPGECVLEIGPGLGQAATSVATWIAPQGRLDVLDVQQVMLDETMRRAERMDIDNITPTLAAAEEPLPYPEASFDAAYLSGVLGEIPDRQRTLNELHRVLKRGGRLVVAEIAGDPDFVPFGSLRRQAALAGFELDRRLGPSLAYMARFLAV